VLVLGATPTAPLQLEQPVPLPAAPACYISHMKTTVDIASNTLARSKKLARRDHTTLRELIHEGLELVLERRRSRPSIPVRFVTFRGRGLAPESRGARWSRIRDAAYEGRGA